MVYGSSNPINILVELVDRGLYASEKLYISQYLYRTSSALMVYRETIVAGVIPTIDVLSQVLGCLRFPYNGSLKERLIENLSVSVDTSKPSNLCSLIDGFGEYDSRAFSILEVSSNKLLCNLIDSYYVIDRSWNRLTLPCDNRKPLLMELFHVCPLNEVLSSLTQRICILMPLR